MWTLTTTTGRTLVLAHLPATLGSAPDADLTLTHASIEPLHAALSVDDDGRRLRVAAIGDAALAIDGRRVERGAVMPGGELVVGRIAFTVGRRGDEPPAPRAEARRRPAPDARRGVTTRSVAGAGRRGTALRTAPDTRRGGLLHTDLSQLDLVGKLLVVGAMLVLVSGLAWGVSLLVTAAM